MKKERVFEAGIFVGVVVVDQLSKILVRQKGLAELNLGGALGLFPAGAWVWISMAVLVGMVGVVVSRKMEMVERAGWLIIISAGVSNLGDRLIWGGVWDWIRYPRVNVMGNLADVLLGVGVVVVVLGGEVNKRRAQKKIVASSKIRT